MAIYRFLTRVLNVILTSITSLRHCISRRRLLAYISTGRVLQLEDTTARFLIRLME